MAPDLRCSEVEETEDALPESIRLATDQQVFDALHIIQTNSQWEPMRPVAHTLLNACKQPDMRPSRDQTQGVTPSLSPARLRSPPRFPIDAEDSVRLDPHTAVTPIVFKSSAAPQLHPVPPRDRGQLPLAYQWSSDGTSNGHLIAFTNLYMYTLNQDRQK